MQTKTKILWLAAILIGQVLIFAFSLGLRPDLQKFEAQDYLLRLDLDHLNKIEFDGREGKKLSLVKAGQKWEMPSLYGFPVDAEKLKSFIEKLNSLRGSWPAGKTLIAAQQFKVVNDDFERKLTFFQPDNKAIKFYLGSSPGFKKVYARVDGSDLTFEVNMSVFDVELDANAWANQNYYRLNREDIKSISIHSLKILNQDNHFELMGLRDTEKMVDSYANSFVEQVLAIPFLEVLSHQEGAYNLESPQVTFSIETKNNQNIKYIVAKLSEDNSVLKISKYPYYFKIASSSIQNIVSVQRSDFIQVQKSEESTNP